MSSVASTSTSSKPSTLPPPKVKTVNLPGGIQYKNTVQVVAPRKDLGNGNTMGPTVQTSSGFHSTLKVSGSITLLVVAIVIAFGLSVYQLVAASIFVRPLFKDPKKDKTTGRFHLTISKHTLNLLKAFTIIFWIVLGLTVLSVGEGQKGSFVNITWNLVKDTSIVWLAFTVVVAVGVGFLTAKIWENHKTHGDQVTLNLSKTQLVFIKIAIVGEIIAFAVSLLVMIVVMLMVGVYLARGGKFPHGKF